MAIERDKFLALKPFDHVIDAGGRFGRTWIVKTIVDGPNGKEVILRRRNRNFEGDAVVEVTCYWNDTHDVAINTLTGQPAEDFNGDLPLIPPESVERVVEEMFALGRLTSEEAERLNKAGANNFAGGQDWD